LISREALVSDMPKPVKTVSDVLGVDKKGLLEHWPQ